MSSEDIDISLSGSATASATGSITVSDAGYVSQTVSENLTQINPLKVSLQKLQYFDPRAQKIVDAVVKGGYDSEVMLLHDINEPGCIDYESGNPCDKTYWPPSDNIPTGAVLADYGYADISAKIIAKVTGLGSLDYTSGIFEHRYEVYLGKPIIRGYPSAGKHGIIKDNAYAQILAQDTGSPFPNMHKFVSSGGASGVNSQGKYTVQFDGSTGQGKGTPKIGVPFDTECPQAINCWIRGDFPLGTELANDVINRWQSTRVTWQRLQIMLVARVYGLDNTPVFQEMEADLWKYQHSDGTLPNTLVAGDNSHDPESNDMAPYSHTIINNLISLKGRYTIASPP